MSTKNNDIDLGLLVRQRGTPVTPLVDATVGEVRTCVNARWLPKWEKGLDDALGAIVVIWDYSVALTDVDEFHAFLRDSEAFISASAKKVMSFEAYRGTYMELGYGNPRYRTIWSYRSLDAIDRWSEALQNSNSPFYQAMLRFRAFWLRDPARSEARWAPARFYFDPESEELADSIAKLTIAAARLNEGRGASVPAESKSRARRKK